MEKQLNSTQNLIQRISLINLVKKASFAYLVILTSGFLVSISFLTNEMFLQGLIALLTFTYFPILLLLALAVYCINLADISRIPKDTTLYEAIMLPTVQCGPIKIIIPIVPPASKN